MNGGTWPNPKTATFIDIDGTRITTTIVDQIVAEQGSGKLVYLQMIRFPDGHLEYRFTYYVMARKGTHKGKGWVFGRNSLVVPAIQLDALLKGAKEKSWKGFLETWLRRDTNP